MLPSPKWLQKRRRWSRLPSEKDLLLIPGVLAPTELEAAFQRERARVDRNDNCFSIVVFRVDGKRPDDLKRLAHLLTERVRAYDAVGLVDRERVATLLPETDGMGSWIFADSAMSQFASLDLRVRCDVYTYPHPGSDEEGSENTNGDSKGRTEPRFAADVSTPRPKTMAPKTPQARPASGVDDPEDNGRPGMRRTGTDGPAMSGAPKRALDADTKERPTARARLRAVKAPLPTAGTKAMTGDSIPFAGGRPVKDLAPLFEERLPLYRRAVDILVSGLAILTLSPILIAAAVAVKTTSPGSMIFSQWRAGRGGRPFRFYKFRSMYMDAEERKNDLRLVNEKDGPIFKIRNDPRITPVGRLIRRLSIDELPQLLNVLKGDMTLVGPRPPVMDEVDAYQAWQRERLDITGGLTCIWQVSGRSEVSFDDWMRMDIRYKHNRTLGMDLKLMWRTFGAVFSGRGAY